MGSVIVEAWLAAHRGQMPDTAWQKRVTDWTPEVSAQAWARAMAGQGPVHDTRDVFLVAEDHAGAVIALLAGTESDSEPSTVATIGALYVLPRWQAQGIGRRLLREAARELSQRGFVAVQIGVLTANTQARGFYEAMGGRELGQRPFDEDGYLLEETVYEWPDITTLADG